MLVEIYHKLLLFVGPGNSNGTVNANTASAALAGGAPPDVNGLGELDMGNVTAQYSHSLLDNIIKVDSKFKKILAQISKELDSLARHLIKEELQALENVVKGAPLSSLGSIGLSSSPPIPSTATSSVFSHHTATGGFSLSSAGGSGGGLNNLSGTTLNSNTYRGHFSGSSVSSSGKGGTASSVFGFTPASTINSHNSSFLSAEMPPYPPNSAGHPSGSLGR